MIATAIEVSEEHADHLNEEGAQGVQAGKLYQLKGTGAVLY